MSAIINIISSGTLSKSFKAIPSVPFLYPIAITKYTKINTINTLLIGIIK